MMNKFKWLQFAYMIAKLSIEYLIQKIKKKK